MNIATIGSVIQRRSTHTKLHCPFYPLPSNRSGRCTSLVFFNLAITGRITTSGIPKSSEVRFLIIWRESNHFLVQQPVARNSMHLHFTHTSHLQLHWSDPHLESDGRSVVELFCGNSQRVKAVGCFCWRAPLLILGSSVLGEGFHHWGYKRESLTPSAS